MNIKKLSFFKFPVGKKISTILVAVLLLIPAALAAGDDMSIGGTIGVEDFPIKIWQCGNRVVKDEAVQPWRLSNDGDVLAERNNNYLFEGETYQVDVLVMDKNKIDEAVVDVMFDSATGTDISLNCAPTDPWAGEMKTDTLCYKGASTGWQCGPNPDQVNYADASGSVVYTSPGPTLEITVELTGLKPNTDYQLTLNGRDGNDGNTELGANCANPNAPAAGYTFAWECGTWAGGTGQEGFWNFDMAATTDANGDFSQSYSLNMPVGHYGIGPAHAFGFGFIVKEAADVPGGSNYPPVLMEYSGLDWTITEDFVINPACNAMIDEESVEWNADLMEMYTCMIEIRDSYWDYGEYELIVQATDNTGNQTAEIDETSMWFLNPLITVDVTGLLDFSGVRPGTSEYSNVQVKNLAEGGVVLDMFILGEDWDAIDPAQGRCLQDDGNLLNQLPLSAFRYYVENGAYSSRGDRQIDLDNYDAAITRNADAEGYLNIHRNLNGGFDEDMFAEAEILQENEIMDPRVPGGEYWVANLLYPQSTGMTLTFRLSLPEPCYGNFQNLDGFTIIGEAI